MTTYSSYIEINNLSFKYPLAEKPAINNINLNIKRGEYVVIAGPTGSGKTTLALCLNGIIPHLVEGNYEGDVIIDENRVADHPLHEMSARIGLVFQNPEDQLFSLNVTDEVAFGIENMGFSRSDIIHQVDQAIKQVNLEHRKNYSIFKLSGGQKQKVAIASNLAISPDILVLDSPTADLDPVSSTEVINTLINLRQQNPDRTFILITNDISDVAHLATRLIILRDGNIFLDGTPAHLLQNHFDDLENLGIRIPDHIRLMYWLSHEFKDLPFQVVDEAVVSKLVDQLIASNQLYLDETIQIVDRGTEENEVIVSLKDASFKFDKGPVILENVNLDIKKGEWVAIIGENGTGKSTVLKMISGLLQPQSGEITIEGINTSSSKWENKLKDIGYLFQNPDHQLFMSTLEEEIAFTPIRQGCSEEEKNRRVDEALKLMGLQEQRNKHPFTLSRGQRQRLAVATVLAAHPKLLLLDEPTTGQDEVSLAGLMQLTHNLISEHEATVVMVTHDMNLVAQYASRVIVLYQGRILFDGSPAEVFTKNKSVLNQVNLKQPQIIALTSHLGYGVLSKPTYEHILEKLIVASSTPIGKITY